jgi:hypothetical protein
LSDEDSSKGLEDVRMSNFAYSQTKISEYISFYFAMLGVGCSIIASEMCASFNDNGQSDEWIVIMEIICDCSTFFLSNLLINSLFSVEYHWKQAFIHQLDEI